MTYLPSILNSLGEYSIIIAQAISIGSQAQGSHGIKEAGCQSTQTAIAKTSIFFDVFEFLNVKAKLHKK